MRKVLATVMLAATALSGVVGPAGPSHAGGPTSVLVSQPGDGAGALYHDDAAYDALLRLLPEDATTGKPLPPGGGGEDYTLTWLVHDVMPWRFDRVHVAEDGTAWVSTTFFADATMAWESLGPSEGLARVLHGVLDEAPDVVTLAPEVEPAAQPAMAPSEAGTPWVSLSGWRWLVPGALLGLLVGAVAARRRVDDGPRQVLLSSEP